MFSFIVLLMCLNRCRLILLMCLSRCVSVRYSEASVKGGCVRFRDGTIKIQLSMFFLIQGEHHHYLMEMQHVLVEYNI